MKGGGRGEVKSGGRRDFVRGVTNGVFGFLKPTMRKERIEWGETKNQNENQGTEDQVVRGMKKNHSGVERKKDSADGDGARGTSEEMKQTDIIIRKWRARDNRRGTYIDLFHMRNLMDPTIQRVSHEP